MASYVDLMSKLDWAMSFQRTGKFPLDRSSMFSSYADAVKYALGDGSDERGLGGTSYIGQPISVFEDDDVRLYIIKADRTLVEVGTPIVGDGKSLTVTTNAEGQNVISINGVADAVEGQVLKIVNVGSPEVPDLQVKWITESTQVTDDLAQDLADLTAVVEGINGRLQTVEGYVGKAASESEEATGLFKAVADLNTAKADKATTLSGYGITDAYTKTEIDGKLTGALHYKGTADTFAALVATVTDGSYVPEKGDTWNITTAGGVDAAGVAIKAGDNVIFNGTGWDVSSGVVDLSAYYTAEQTDAAIKVVTDDIGTYAESDVPGTGVKGKISALEADVAQINHEATKVEKSDVNGNIKINDAEVTVYTLPTADASTKGGVVSSADQDKVAVGADGTMTVNNISASKVQGAVDKASGLEMADGTVVDADAILADSKDGVVKEATKVSHTITIGAKTFDGSADVSITSADTPIPEDVVRKTTYATDTVGGVIKTTSANNGISVNGEGVAEINKIDPSKIDGSVASAAKVDNALTVSNGKAGDQLVTKTFDGSAAVTITAADLNAVETEVLDTFVEYTDIATADKTGVVKSSADKNNVTVNADGTMTVNTIDISKVDGTIDQAKNVSETINNVAITEIFEADGKTAKAASKLATARTISASGAATGSVTFDGTGDADIALTLKDSGVTAGTFTKVTVDAKGIVTAAETLAASDIPTITLDKISDAGELAALDKVARANITAELEADIKALENASHTHDNKTVLDGITSAKIDGWDHAAAKIDDKPDKATTLAGYGIEDAYTKSEVNGMVAGAFHYKGTVETFDALVASVTGGSYTPLEGDTWNITNAGGTDSKGVAIKAGDNVSFYGNADDAGNSGWDVLAGTTDLSAYYTSAQVDAELAKKADKTAFEAVEGRVDTLESTVGHAAVEGDSPSPATGLVKAVGDLQVLSASNASRAESLENIVGHAADGENPATGLVKSVADNTAAIEKLNGEANVDGSVKNLIAASAADINAAITNITKENGTIDTKIATHNTAEDAHADLFAKKQNNVIVADVTFLASNFVLDPEAADYGATGTQLIPGIETTKNYIANVTPSRTSENTILDAHFAAEVAVENGNLILYARRIPADDIVLSVTFTEVVTA